MSYSQLKARAKKRLSQGLGTQYPRVLVQVANCSQAVGAGEALESLRREVTQRGLKVSVVEAGCDGACYQAPVVLLQHPDGRAFRFTQVVPSGVPELVQGWLEGKPDDLRPWNGESPLWTMDGDKSGFWSLQKRLVLEDCGQISSQDIDEYIARGGYASLGQVLSSLSPEQVIETVEKSGLAGRGGAYFPVARKWQGARAQTKTPRYLVINAEEGEPGIFKDRHIMEGISHRLIEGMVIAAYAIGAERGFLYINGEAHLSAQRMIHALRQAEENQLLGDNILDSGFSFHVEVRRGAGGYVLGEETALLNSIEGERDVPRTRPPFPVEAGLWQQPTVINNVETLSNLPYILSPNGADFASLGIERSKGTKVISLSGRVERPGLVEVPMGTTIRRIVFDIGGGPLPGHDIKGVVAGGPSGGLLPYSQLDIPIQSGMLDEQGAVLGSGGITVLDETISTVEAVRRLAAYNAAESCSKCTPCREGTDRILHILDKMMEGKGQPQDLDDLTYLAEIVGFGSLCGLGQMAGGPIRSGMHHFGDEFAASVGVPKNDRRA
ncbi:MAG: NADH-ubiquinone oxidoreductase-F iron-sulfur binding region domain-containing protein [Dehalococcoidia bacterium]